MRIAIFGGSFDPVHIEHIRMAESAVISLGLDKLLVMPAHTPPHKRGKRLSSDKDRAEMCRLAFSSEMLPLKIRDKIEVSDYELTAGGTSYTYLTVSHFKAYYESVYGRGNVRLFWLVGTDMLRDFPTWREPSTILENATLAVCARAEENGWAEKERAEFFKKFGTDFVTIAYEGKAVSSTEIRVLAGAGERLSQKYVEKSVAEYIEKNGLYAINGAKEALSLEKQTRKEHSIRVAMLAASRAPALKIDERAAITAALFHDCGKNLPPDSPYLKDFRLPQGAGEVPEPVLHQYTGAYVAEHFFGVTDEEILDAIRYHTSGRADMTPLGKLIFLSDMLESGRNYDGVDALRALFHATPNSLDACMETALYETLLFLRSKGSEIYPLTQAAYDFFKK